ncbi:low molecular weight phosphotyrosine protein phosphatase-like protein [Macroventuria anomochaeta]|uniref:Low molecular weight phosphotyrosine protein phosphatase-like protein n=1 Tax=Macroventuria anomochaeta TaxID=301207 RepID=A0ACB6S940_9PLEO|nr:low molecular weight phosphotyrosine protein phosphatase-like protein [Macroventuria anomochaeta]KAF2630493.1 low molecular weight phosphotyrosine protein phosphatase-like protein [Macroventuria anomochaeta]
MGDSATPKPVAVLFVCLGNICVFQSLVTSSSPSTQRLITTIDSSGTGAYHVGDAPDPRTMATLKQNGITNYKHAARKFAPASDFEKFDYILAMDDSNLEDLEDLRRRAVKRKDGDEGFGKVMLFGEFGGKVRRSGRGEEVQDPYYGANDGFTTAYEQAVKFSKVFLERLERGELS